MSFTASSILEDFEDFQVRSSSDLAKPLDNELICPQCDGVVCDVEDGDTLGTLVRAVREHLLACTETAG